jgi:hypothetical protein
VFAGWRPEGITVDWTGFDLIIHNGLPYVQFGAETDRGYVSVRCDPCSLDQDRTAYAAMVRADLEGALRKLGS